LRMRQARCRRSSSAVTSLPSSFSLHHASPHRRPNFCLCPRLRPLHPHLAWLPHLWAAHCTTPATTAKARAVQHNNLDGLCTGSFSSLEAAEGGARRARAQTGLRNAIHFGTVARRAIRDKHGSDTPDAQSVRLRLDGSFSTQVRTWEMCRVFRPRPGSNEA
jgi:hypothetical protein